MSSEKKMKATENNGGSSIKIESTRERQKSWRDYYAEIGTAMNIECTKCQKWRKVTDYYESKDVPDNWHCGMAYLTTNKKRADCSLDSLWESSSMSSKTPTFYPGQVVWVKQSAHPWWPAMIEDDPDIEEFYVKIPNKRYHVTFFGERVSRGWIFVKRIFCYEKYRNNTKVLFKKRKMSECLELQLKNAIKQAEKAYELKLPDRLMEYSFSTCYKGKMPAPDPEVVALEGVKRDDKILQLKKEHPEQFWTSDPKLKLICIKSNSGDKNASSSELKDKNGIPKKINKSERRREIEKKKLEKDKSFEIKKDTQEKHYKVEIDDSQEHSYNASSETSDYEGPKACLLQSSSQFNGKQKIKRKVLSKKRHREFSDEEIIVKRCNLRDLDASSNSSVSCSPKQPDANQCIVSNDDVNSHLISVENKSLQSVPTQEGQLSRESSMSPICLSDFKRSSSESDSDTSLWSKYEADEVIQKPSLSLCHESSQSDDEIFIIEDPKNTIMDENTLR